MNADMVTLIGETEHGYFVRRIFPATSVPEDLDVGGAVEAATRSSAALFGLPDFVFRPSTRSNGSKTRELGDAILVVGDVAAVVQVKARSRLSTKVERERAWLGKAISKAARQGAGTIREMTRNAVELTNERGNRLVIDGRMRSWVAVVVVDHPAPPVSYVPAPEKRGCVVILRRDWEFLFEQLGSVKLRVARS